MNDHVVIVGAGHGAGQAAAALRQSGWEGDITLVGEEAYPPYQRPPLSKKFLAGELEFDRLFFKPEAFWEAQNVGLKLGARVDAIDRGAKRLSLGSGDSLAYDKLILATGTRVRLIDCPGADAEGVHYLRSIDDVRAIQPGFEAGKNLVVVGGGYIGLEVAAVAAERGLNVTVLEAADRVLARVAGEQVSEFYQEAHRAAGVDVRLGAGLTAFVEKKGLFKKPVLKACALSDGTEIPADIAVVGIGILPNQELAAEAGLKTDNGIWVDEFARTEDDNIYAIGDCTNHPNPIYGRRLRLESVHNALEQGKTAAKAICGKAQAYAQVPWFWSDQYDLKLQTQGLSQGFDETVLRGSPDARKFAVFYLKEGRLLAVDAVNAPMEFLGSKALIAAGASPSPAALADESVSLKELASA